MFLKNAWYVAAWSDSVSAQPLARKICNTNIVLFRDETGSVAALEDVCPHRFAPLSLGKVIDGSLRCPYHGLQFGADGRCVHNPHGDGRISERMQTRHFPVVERYDMIWLWFGEPEEVDTTAIPDFSFNTAQGFRRIGGEFEVAANYELISDNILDATHGEFVHEGLLSSDGLLTSQLETIQDGTTVWSNRFCPNDLPPPAWRMAFNDYSKPVDLWFYARWDAPAHMVFDVGVCPTGTSRAEGMWLYGTDIVTPIDEKNSIYFWAFARSYGLDDDSVDELWRGAMKVAFEEQDKTMFEAQQRAMGDKTFEEMKPIFIAPDAAALRARRVLAKLIDEEQSSSQKPLRANPCGRSPLELLRERESLIPVVPCT